MHLEPLRRLLGRLLVALMLFAPAPGFAADSSDVQLWPSFQLNHAIGDKLGGHFLVRGRFDQDVSRTKDLLVRPFVTLRPGLRFTADLGYDYLKSYTSRDEHRAWQALQHAFSWAELTIGNRVRLDQRWVEDVDGVVVRFRYRLRGTHPIGDSGLYGAMSDEVFANVNDQGAGPVSGFEQNRLRFALGFRAFERFKLETGYEWQYNQSRSGSDENRHVITIELSTDTGTLPDLDWAPR